jgi:hypothetical protein
VERIYLNLPRYAFELHGISLSAPGREEPVLEIETVRGKLRLATLLTFELRWGELSFEGLTISLVEDPETGIVLPSGRSKATRLAGITLAADSISVTRAVLRIANQRVPWTLQASDMSMVLNRLRDDRFSGRFAYDSGVLKIKNHENLSAGLTADFELVPHELLLREATVTSEFGSIRGTGKIGLAGGMHARFEVEAEGDSGRVAQALFGVQGAPRLVQGSASFRGMLTTSPESKTLEGTLVLPEGQIAGIPIANWNGEVFWDRSMLSIGYARGTFASGNARLQVQQLLPVAEHAASLSFDFDDASLRTVFSGLSGVTSPIASRVSGKGTFSFAADRPEEIQGSFELDGAEPPPEHGLAGALPVSFRAKGSVSDQTLAIEELQLDTSFLSGRIRGTYPRHGEADLSVAIVSSDLASARAFQREVERALAGQHVLPPDEWEVEGSGRAVGRLRQRFPRLVFEGDIAADALRLTGLQLGSVQTRAIVSRDAVTFQDLSAVRCASAISTSTSLSSAFPFPAFPIGSKGG